MSYIAIMRMYQLMLVQLALIYRIEAEYRCYSLMRELVFMKLD